MPPPSGPVRSIPPGPAVAAAVLALISGMVPALFGLVAVVLSGLRFRGTEWLLLLVPVVLTGALLVGAGLLLLGRSWLVLVLAAGGLAVLLVVGRLLGGWGGSGWFGVLAWLLPTVTAVLGALPPVRRWVSARRSLRRAA